MADDEAFMHDFAKNALGKDWRVVDCKTVGEVVDVVNKLESRESRERESQRSSIGLFIASGRWTRESPVDGRVG